MIVVDASVVVSALVDGGPTGRWAEQVLIRCDAIAAPAILHVETANVLRRAEASGQISAEVAALAFSDLMALPVLSYPFEVVAARVWALRPNITAYDAWYVALAEELGAPLATLDGRLAQAPGTVCGFMVPPDGH